jgi:hypothetical protein
LNLIASKLSLVRKVLDIVQSYVPTDAQIQAWQNQIAELKVSLNKYPAFTDNNGNIPTTTQRKDVTWWIVWWIVTLLYFKTYFLVTIHRK